MFVIYMQTFIVFPGICLKWSPAGDWVKEDTYGLIVVSAFQVFDLVGRFLCSKGSILKYFPKGNRVWWLIAARTLLIPLGVLCWLAPWDIFKTTLAHGVVIALYGASQGMVTNLTFIWAGSDTVPWARDVVGRALPLFLCIGVTAGSALTGSLVKALDS